METLHFTANFSPRNCTQCSPTSPALFHTALAIFLSLICSRCILQTHLALGFTNCTGQQKPDGSSSLGRETLERGSPTRSPRRALYARLYTPKRPVLTAARKQTPAAPWAQRAGGKAGHEQAALSPSAACTSPPPGRCGSGAGASPTRPAACARSPPGGFPRTAAWGGGWRTAYTFSRRRAAERGKTHKTREAAAGDSSRV